MKKLLVVVGVLVVLAAVGAVLLLANLGAVIRSAVETIGSDATGAKVTLASADVSLTSGEGTLKGLEIGNPAGFREPTAFELDLVTVRIDPESVAKDVIVIREVTIDGPRVTYELDAGFGSNLAAIQRNVETYAGGGAGGGAGTGGGTRGREPAKPDAGAKRFIVETFRIRGGRVTLAAAVAGDKVKAAEIPEVEVKGLGRAKGGATAEELAAEALEILAKESIAAATRSEFERRARDILGGLEKKAKGLLDGVLGKDKERR